MSEINDKQLHKTIDEMARKIEVENFELEKNRQAIRDENERLKDQIKAMGECIPEEGIAKMNKLSLLSKERFGVEIESLKQGIKSQSGDMAVLDETIARIKAEMTNLENEVSKTVEELESLKLKSNVLKVLKQTKAAELGSRQNNLHVQEEEERYLRKRTDDLQIERNFFVDQLDQEEREMKSLRNYEQCLIDEKTQLHHELEMGQERNTALVGELSNMQTAHNEKKAQLNKLETECAQRRQEITHLFQEIEGSDFRLDDNRLHELRRQIEDASELPLTVQKEPEIASAKKGGDNSALPSISPLKPALNSARFSIIERMKAIFKH